MAPTRKAQRQEATAAILEAALALFAERGFAATSIQAIAERAGVSKGLVYHYFPTKGDLVVGVITQRQRAVAELIADVPAELSPLDKLARVVRRVVADVVREPAHFRVVLRASCDPDIQTYIQSLDSPSSYWLTLFEGLGADRPAERAQFFRAALLGVLTTLATSNDDPDPDGLTRQLLALLPRQGGDR